MLNLVELKKQTLDYLDKVKFGGGSLSEYNCPDCGKVLLTHIPTTDEIWDSFVTCYECGKLHFYIKTKNGVEAKSLSKEQAKNGGEVR